MGVVSVGEQALDVEVLKGKFRGEKLSAVNNLIGKLKLDKIFKTGDTAFLKKVLQESKTEKSLRENSAQNYLLYGGYEPLTTALARILSSKAELGWTTYSHTGVPVPTYAMGIGQEMSNGYYENTDIFNKINYVIK